MRYYFENQITYFLKLLQVNNKQNDRSNLIEFLELNWHFTTLVLDFL